MNHNTDPYKILQLERGATRDEVKRAYYYIAKMYDPKNGGSQQEYNRFRHAYRQIISELDGDAIIPAEPQDPDNFNNNDFNSRFLARKRNTEGDGYVYNIDDTGYSDRDKAAYQHERAKVTAEAESIQPMFEGRFNNNVFNRIFNREKALHGGDDVHQGMPKPLPGVNNIQYSDINQIDNSTNVSKLNYAGIEIFDKHHHNPKKYNKRNLQRMSKLKDVTKQAGMSAAEAKKRMGAYQSTPIDYNKQTLNTSTGYYINDGMGGGCQMGDIDMSQLQPTNGNVQQAMQRKINELRQDPSMLMGHKPQMPPRMMNYPVNSSGQLSYNHNREMAGQIRATIPSVGDHDLLMESQSFMHQQAAMPPPQQPRMMQILPQHQQQHQHQHQQQHQQQPIQQMPMMTPEQLMYHQYQQQNQQNQQLLMQQHQKKDRKKILREQQQTIKLQQKMIQKLLKQRQK